MSNTNDSSRGNTALFHLDPDDTLQDLPRQPLVAYAIASVIAVPILMAGWTESAYAQTSGSEGSSSSSSSSQSSDKGGDAGGMGGGPDNVGSVAGMATGTASGVSGMMGGDGGERVIVLDVRPRSDFAKSHVPKAINMPVRYSEVLREHVVDDKAPLGADKAARIVVYGAGPNDPAAAAVVRQATAEGYTNVIWMRGGFAEWVSARLPTTQS